MAKHAILILYFLMSVLQIGNAQFAHYMPEPKDISAECDTVSLVMIGDVMMHAKQLEYDNTGFLKHINHKLKSADLALANMEFSLGGRPYSGYPQFSAPDSYAATIAEDSGVDVMLVANNHLLDRGKKGMKRSLAVYDSLGVKHSGRDYPLFVSRKGIKIALINFSYGSNLRDDGQEPRLRTMNKEEIGCAFEKAKDNGADFIIALPHWGDEYSLIHNESQEDWAEWLVEQGADAIIGTHPPRGPGQHSYQQCPCYLFHWQLHLQHECQKHKIRAHSHSPLHNQPYQRRD